ncbi:MAG: RsmB/NOP family class I SAM-dependent RNA methyltransferase [Thermanaeromonas sp.]|uniref:RsmB/NOP family class I SAM-dependent RNA methyltransferase n=1 Tax=Thermanaeromonas sp. TaxID=2003697 RepID=UPI00243FD80D|nr:RsmB/NOP family class I SAM-dependent RNA methyltransferase [Thermanaeromonas sp.]MCG0277156.1 RsmB/NOP family class I SAM-dependent RNA methyltransferase [Thermanaeromonas sp.]
MQNLAFNEVWRQRLGPEYDDFMQALKRGARLSLRVNTLKLRPEEFLRISPFPLAPVPWCLEGWIILEGEQKAGRHPYHAAGLYYIQDPATMAAAGLLDPQPGEWVLDLCASPGGKASHLAARMENEGVLVANEVNPRRASVLAFNLERMGVTNAIILNERAETLAARWAGLFDRVLVDAPCSGEAVLARDPGAFRAWSKDLLKRFARRQLELLYHASHLVRPGGWLLYATCSFSPEENEGVISRFLEKRSDFILVDPSRHPLFSPGRPEWIEGGDPQLKWAVRLWPHLAPGHGHFYALLKHQGEGYVLRRRNKSYLSLEAEKLYEEFCRHNLKELPATEGLIEKGGQIYRTPLPLEMWKGLKVVRPGWWLGRIYKGRFQPDHALALGIKAEKALRVKDLPLDSAELKAYLRGEWLEGGFKDGPVGDAGEEWVLVTVGGFPLGWARSVAGGLKSLYPRHFRAAWGTA